MAVKIKLKRLGKIRNPQYRIVIADARTKREGRAIEEIGLYHPKEEPSLIQVDSERAQHWLSVGAQPTEPVLAILKVTGDWQKFKGLPGAEGTLRFAAARPDKEAAFQAALAAAHADGSIGGDATTARRSRKTAPGAPAADTPAADAAPATDAAPVTDAAPATDGAPVTDAAAPPADASAPAVDGSAEAPAVSPTVPLVGGGTGTDAPRDTNPAESAELEATAADPTTGGDTLPEAAVADDSAPSHESSTRPAGD